MSFASETKNELARIEPEKKCCQLAEISGFLRVAGSLRLAGGGKFRIVITTENPAIARHYKKLIREYFGIETRLEIGEGTAVGKSRSSRHYAYSITIDPENLSEQILRETGILLIKEGNNYISDGIYSGIIKTKCCRKAYLRGIFIGAGTISDPEKGYHLEFSLASRNLANDLKRMINTFDDLSARVVERKGRWIVYMKNSQYISDTLALMGASTQMLKFENTRIRKGLMNQTMRIMNCDTANTDRTLDASQKQGEAIRKLMEAGLYEKLSPKLAEVADLRLRYPEASLTQLGEMLDPPLKKSGVNNRLKRLVEMAEKIEPGGRSDAERGCIHE